MAAPVDIGRTQRMASERVRTVQKLARYGYPMFVGTYDEKYIFFFQSQIADIDVCRYIYTGQMADMDVAVRYNIKELLDQLP